MLHKMTIQVHLSSSTIQSSSSSFSELSKFFLIVETPGRVSPASSIINGILVLLSNICASHWDTRANHLDTRPMSLLFLFVLFHCLFLRLSTPFLDLNSRLYLLHSSAENKLKNDTCLSITKKHTSLIHCTYYPKISLKVFCFNQDMSSSSLLRTNLAISLHEVNIIPTIVPYVMRS